MSDSTVAFSASAAAKVKELLAADGGGNKMLRVYVQGGGCSGFQYGFEFAERLEEGDVAVETDGVTLIVDPMSMQYLDGAEVDYVNDLTGAQFVVRNPNASTTCGCGSSFSI